MAKPERGPHVIELGQALVDKHEQRVLLTCHALPSVRNHYARRRACSPGRTRDVLSVEIRDRELFNGLWRHQSQEYQ